MEDYYQSLDRIFSSASEIYDEKILSNFINVNIRNKEIKILLKLSPGRKSVLEIGCGTGEEASRFIRETGKHLACIDISSGMIEKSRAKMKMLGISDKFTTRRLPARDASAIGMKFDLIYSFNGAFNTEPDYGGLVQSLMDITEKGSLLIFSLRNRFCLGESVIYTLTGRKSTLRSRRGPYVEVEVAGQKIRSNYYSIRDIRRMFSRGFRMKSHTGHAVIAPPYMAERIENSLLKRAVNFLDNILSSLPVFRGMGDEITYVMERK